MLEFGFEGSQSIRLENDVDHGAITKQEKRLAQALPALTMNKSPNSDILTFRQMHPEVIVHGSDGRSMFNGRHCTDEDAIYFLFAERLKESAECAVARLSWHRSSGFIEK